MRESVIPFYNISLMLVVCADFHHRQVWIRDFSLPIIKTVYVYKSYIHFTSLFLSTIQKCYARQGLSVALGKGGTLTLGNG